MAYQTFRVEVTRDETRDRGPVSIEITAYIDRMPETNDATIGRLSRAVRGVWNSRRFRDTGGSARRDHGGLSRSPVHPLLRIFGRRRVCARSGAACAIGRQMAAGRLVSSITDAAAASRAA